MQPCTYVKSANKKTVESSGAFHLHSHNTLNPLNPVSGEREERETAFEERGELRSEGSTLTGRGKIFEIIDAAGAEEKKRKMRSDRMIRPSSR